MELSADGKKAVCPYCGHEILIEQEDSAKKEYEQCIEKARAEEDIRDLQDQRRRRRRLKGWLIALCLIAVICLINVFIPNSPLRELVFPRTAERTLNFALTTARRYPFRSHCALHGRLSERSIKFFFKQLCCLYKVGFGISNPFSFFTIPLMLLPPINSS